MHNVHHPERYDFRYAGWLKAEEGIVLANIFAALLIDLDPPSPDSFCILG